VVTEHAAASSTCDTCAASTEATTRSLPSGHPEVFGGFTTATPVGRQDALAMDDKA
jgi:hypothetical protein